MPLVARASFACVCGERCSCDCIALRAHSHTSAALLRSRRRRCDSAKHLLSSAQLTLFPARRRRSRAALCARRSVRALCASEQSPSKVSLAPSLSFGRRANNGSACVQTSEARPSERARAQCCAATRALSLLSAKQCSGRLRSLATAKLR